jgi:hypothetical protein
VQRNEAFLEACGQIRAGNNGTAVQVVLDSLEIFPELVRSAIVVPELRKAAAAAKGGKPEFSRKYSRPQILEVLEAPLTWIHGARVGVWSFPERTNAFLFEAPEPRFLLVTGRGPGGVSSRVSANVNDLASERNCAADLVLAGFARFDLRESSGQEEGPEKWTADQFCSAVAELAKEEGASGAISAVGPSYIRSLAPRVLRHTVGIMKQTFQGMEHENGFVRNVDLDMERLGAAEDRLAGGSSETLIESMPVLAEYRIQGEPLEVELNDACLGSEAYANVVREYKGAVRRQRVEEWERRLGRYQNWGQGSIGEWQRLRKMDEVALEAYSTLIHWEVNLETATRVPLDPPKRISGAERLQSLSPFIADNLAWWALAKYRIKTVSKQADFHAWMDSYLVDAFLRGEELPLEERELQRHFESWKQEWRPLALQAMEGALRKRGVRLADIATEQTVFRVVNRTKEKVVLRVLHVWDASLDEAPGIREGGLSLYRPRFGGRSATLVEGRRAQEAANRHLEKALAAGANGGPELVAALGVDSGAAIDSLADRMAEPLRKRGITKDLEKAAEEAARLDPLLRFRFWQKLRASRTIQEYLLLAQECDRESKRAGAPPDLLAWEIYLVGAAVKDGIGGLAIFQAQYGNAGLLFELGQQSALRASSEVVKTMRGWSVWQIAEAAGTSGGERDIISSILKNYGGQYSVETLGMLPALLRSKDFSYAEQCFVSEGGPPRSAELDERSAPKCLEGWTAVCFFLAMGDAAAELALPLIPGGQGLDSALLGKLIQHLESQLIRDAFPDVESRRVRLIEELKKFLGASDVVSLEFASSKIRSAVIELTDDAAAAYRAGAMRDGRHGAGWLRLAGLKWSLGQYGEGLSILAGPPPAAHLEAGRFPLALALRMAGGSLSFSMERKGGSWTSPSETLLSFSGPEDSGSLTAEFLRSLYPHPKIGECVISGLALEDAQLLGSFLQMYGPETLRSVGSASLEEWFSLLQVPTLGPRGGLASAMGPEARFAFLAAGVYLGVPPPLLPLEGQEPVQRPKAWQDGEVITSLAW